MSKSKTSIARYKLQEMRDTLQYLTQEVDHLLGVEKVDMPTEHLPALQWLVQAVEKQCPVDWREELQTACDMAGIPVPW